MSKFYKLNAGKVLSITVDSSARYARQKYGDYDHGDNYVSLSAGTTLLGPFTQDRLYRVDPLSGSDPVVSEVVVAAAPVDSPTFTGTPVLPEGGWKIGETTVGSTGAELNKLDGALVTTTELNYVDNVTSSIQTQLNAKKPNIVTDNVGTAATNITAAESGDGYKHTTVLTVTDAVLPAITGGGNESLGVLLYTLPAGACIVESAYMSLAIQQQDGNITADTPDGGLGTTLANDTQATLDADDAACENIITGQTFNDCDGTAEVKTVGDQLLVIESAGDHTVYFNVADGWAASGDTGALVSGTVVLHWQFMN